MSTKEEVTSSILEVRAELAKAIVLIEAAQHQISLLMDRSWDGEELMECKTALVNLTSRKEEIRTQAGAIIDALKSTL